MPFVFDNPDVVAIERPPVTVILARVCIPAFTAAPIPSPAINSVGLKNCPKKPLP
jgi:hypothetical protein